MKQLYCASAHKHRFCPSGTCSTCDRRRGMLMPVSLEVANKNKDFFAIYYTDQAGVLRWTVPPGITNGKYSWRYSRRVKVPESNVLLMARAALEAGLPDYTRMIVQELPGVE